MNRPRDKGTMAESAVVAYLRANGFLQAERRSLKGSLDQGDVTGTPGLCWEVKYANAGLRLSSWIAETEIERLNSRSDFGILVIKPKGLGTTSVAHWYAAMSLPGHDHLMKQAIAQTAGYFVPVAVGEPFRYTAGMLSVRMAGMRTSRAILREQDHMIAVTATPPGAKDNPSQHYRVMYLDEMVRLVRLAGYGDRDDGSRARPQ